MCGVFGIIRRESMHESRFRDERDRAHLAIARRGPDGTGEARLDCYGFKVAIGHSRLSIFDLSSQGSQPMREPESDWCITFNGAIYNYVELKSTLQSLGWKFNGTSDTEVLLKAWAQWGVDALPRLNGMFAFCVFNQRRGEMWLVRDRFGVKPLLWSQSEHGVLFSSSVTAIAESIAADVDINYCSRAVRYRVFETPGSEAPFDDVLAVPAGSWIKFQLRSDTIERHTGRWYSLGEAVSETIERLCDASDEALLSDCCDLLEDAVKIRLRSDAPLAVSLSGGVDSTTVAAHASRGMSNLKGFTYGSPEAIESEGPDVDLFTKFANLSCEYIWPTLGEKELDALLERAFTFHEAPFGGLSTLAHNEVLKVVRQRGFKVLLGGQGGDEGFAGYRKFFVVAARDAKKSGNLIDIAAATYSLGRMLLAELSQAKDYWQMRRRYINPSEASFKLLSWEPQPINLFGEQTSLRERQEMDILQYSLPSLLRMEDRNSMGYGLETRLPFMDYRLLELALALPTRLKISRGYGKWALRHMAKGYIPDQIRLRRQKRGFDTRQGWIAKGLGNSLRSRILDNRSALAPHLKQIKGLDDTLSLEALTQDSALVDEALMLAWLVNPIRTPIPNIADDA